MQQNSEETKYALLNSDEFYKVYKDILNLEANNYYFITKAYYERENVVAIYEEESEKDCYFQLPEYRTKLVPYDRRYIYYLPKGMLQSVTKGKAPDGRYNIGIGELIIACDPYNHINFLDFSTEKIEVKPNNIYSELEKLKKDELAMLIVKATSLLLTKTE